MSRIEIDTAFVRLRISAPKRAINSECAPRSLKKSSATEARSIFITSMSAPASARSISVRGAMYSLLRAATRGPLGGGRFLRSAVWLDVIVDAAEIAGAIDSLGGVVRNIEKIRNELLAGQVLAIEIAGGKPDAGNADLAGRAVRQRRVVVRIENDDGVGGQRGADGHLL